MLFNHKQLKCQDEITDLYNNMTSLLIYQYCHIYSFIMISTVIVITYKINHDIL